jgi:hypothetical protein
VANKSQKAPPEDVLTRLRDGHRNDPDIQEIVRLLRLGNFFCYESLYGNERKDDVALLHFNILGIAGLISLSPWQGVSSSTLGQNVELAASLFGSYGVCA